MKSSGVVDGVKVRAGLRTRLDAPWTLVDPEEGPARD